MSGIWYKTKEHYDIMENFMTKADQLESSEVWELITELREVAQEYHERSLKKAKREERLVDLSEIADRYSTLVSSIQATIDTASSGSKEE